MTDIFEVSDAFVVATAALDPMLATFWGVPGHDAELTDYSPDGWDARLDLNRRTRAVLDQLRPRHRRDGIAIAVMAERLDSDRTLIESREYHRWLSVMNSHHEYIREVFDFMPRDTVEDWSTIKARLAAVPDALAGLRASFEHAAASGKVAARRQVLACAEQCAQWSAVDGPFCQLAAESHTVDLDAEARAAAAAYAAFGRWLCDDYAPQADQRDAVGPERYQMLARHQNGADLDIAEVYDWGWDELHRIQSRIAELVAHLQPGGTLAECIERLADSTYVIEGAERFVAWNQDVIDRTIVELDGVHFDIPEPLRVCRVTAGPPGGPRYTYYTPPSEDFSRPGQTWVPVEGRTRFTVWDALSIAYHEGAPGHHLQLAQMMHQAESLTRFQRVGVIIAGHGEGWAMYAERLMLELGYFAEPAYELGFLVGQALRAARVIIDIGLHCELRIPRDEAFHPGEVWRTDLVLPFLCERTGFTAEHLSSEVDRYLGMPAQSISYKLGERVWLEGRDRARQRLGDRFDLRAFHTQMLDAGAMGLDLLRDELDRFGESDAQPE